MKVLVTGASGFLGREIAKELVRRGHHLVVLRQKSSKTSLPFPCEILDHDLEHSPIQNSAFDNIEAIVHLAGENIGAGRWSFSKKKRILDSRVKVTENLIKSFADASQLKTVVMASAVGIYGDRGNDTLTEDSTPGTGFLSEVCIKWELALKTALTQRGLTQSVRARHVIFRLGMVLGRFGGVLQELIPLFRSGFGASLGSGNQWLSWIHLQDAVSLFCNAVADNRFEGTYNAVAEEVVTQADFNLQLAKEFRRRLLPNVPAFVLKTCLGEKSHIVLDSTRVKNMRLNPSLFTFDFPKLAESLSSCCEVHRGFHNVVYFEQFVPFQRSKVFSFFAKPENLETITPPSLSFQILQKSKDSVEKNVLIDYKLSLYGIPLRWKTLISEWSPNHSFQDEQLKGPYRLWKHKHEFSDLASGTLMTDCVQYKIPFGIVGLVFGGAFVKKDVFKIFNFRNSVIKRLVF